MLCKTDDICSDISKNSAAALNCIYYTYQYAVLLGHLEVKY